MEVFIGLDGLDDCVFAQGNARVDGLGCPGLLVLCVGCWWDGAGHGGVLHGIEQHELFQLCQLTLHDVELFLDVVVFHGLLPAMCFRNILSQQAMILPGAMRFLSGSVLPMGSP